MCGIAGVLTFDGRPIDADALARLTSALSHRGRDSAGVACGGPHAGSLSVYPGIGLGHRRLSIIDLSAESAQPMEYGAGRFWITYNGELYNFETLRQELQSLGRCFRTQSDTEVVLAAYATWGEDCLRRFNGMFAFAIWDEAQQHLFCARDAIGVKPFYYTVDRGTFRFASESQALAPAGSQPALDRDALRAYLLSMYVPGPMSMYVGVRKLLPGEFMRVGRDGTIVTRSFWQTPRCDYDDRGDADAAVQLRALLDRAVALQLRSDVPVGALLSGGFDSGMVVASAARHATLHTYSVAFDSARQVDELPIARALAQRYGTRHHERIIHSDEIVSMLDRALASMSEPVADSAVVPTHALSEMAAADGVKVLLSGTGGDEVFAGYPRYIGTEWPRRVLLSLPDAVRSLLAVLVDGRAALGARLRHRTLDMLMTTGGSPRLARFLFDDERAFGVYLESLAVNTLPAASECDSDLYQHMEFDLRVYLPDLLLLLLDQLTMAHTLEGRVPLLDPAVIAASYSLRPAVHATRSQTKRLMRLMAADRLDARTLCAPKQGFSGPVEEWIAGNRQVFVDRTMAARDIPGVAQVPVDRLWQDGAARGNPRWAAEIFSLFCLSTWYHAHAPA